MKSKMDELYTEYTHKRLLEINQEQFVYMAHLLPSCLIVMSDGLLDHDEWVTLERLSRILGSQLVSEELGSESKKEDLMETYKEEMRYLLKNRAEWEHQFISALRDYLENNEGSKEFLQDTMDLFGGEEQLPDETEEQTYNRLRLELRL